MRMMRETYSTMDVYIGKREGRKKKERNIQYLREEKKEKSLLLMKRKPIQG